MKYYFSIVLILFDILKIELRNDSTSFSSCRMLRPSAAERLEAYFVRNSSSRRSLLPSVD